MDSPEDRKILNSKISELISLDDKFFWSNIDHFIDPIYKDQIQGIVDISIKNKSYKSILDNVDELKKYITKEQIQGVVDISIKNKSYNSILDNVDKLADYITKEQIQGVVDISIGYKDYKSILDNVDKLADYITKEQIQEAVDISIKNKSYNSILDNVDELKKYITKEQIQEAVDISIGYKDYESILDNVDKLADYITKEQIQEAVDISIKDGFYKSILYKSILYNVDELKKYITKEQIQEAVDISIGYKDYKYILDNVDELKKYITKEQIQGVVDISIKDGYYKSILENLDKLEKYITKEQIQEGMTGNISDWDYNSITNNFYKLIGIVPTKDLIYVVSNEIGLKSTIKINSLHNSPDNIRFKSIENKSAEDYIMIISAGREEIYTSSFLYVFNKKLIPELKNNPNIIKNMLDKGVIKNRDILKLINASTFFGDSNGRNGVSNLLMDNLSIVDQNIIIDTIFNDINMKKNPEYAIVLHELLEQNRDNKNLINSIIQKVKENYNKSDIKSKKIYLQLINVILRDKIVDNNLFSSIDRKVLEKYYIADISKMDTNILFKNGVNTQRYYFYGDEDGVTSYQNFLSYYKSNKDYKITYNNDQKYIIIEKSVKNKTIRIYANTPEIKNYKESNNSSINNLDQLFKSNNITANYIVHRGHSYHVGATIGAINKDTQIIFLGSCGGYNNISSALRNTENITPIISTTSTGTKYVNDPLLRIINEHILHKDKLTWKQVWEEYENSIKDNRFSGYVRPDLNKYSVWISTINKVKDTEVPDSIN